MYPIFQVTDPVETDIDDLMGLVFLGMIILAVKWRTNKYQWRGSGYCVLVVLSLEMGWGWD